MLKTIIQPPAGSGFIFWLKNNHLIILLAFVECIITELCWILDQKLCGQTNTWISQRIFTSGMQLNHSCKIIYNSFQKLFSKVMYFQMRNWILLRMIKMMANTMDTCEYEGMDESNTDDHQ